MPLASPTLLISASLLAAVLGSLPSATAVATEMCSDEAAAPKVLLRWRTADASGQIPGPQARGCLQVDEDAQQDGRRRFSCNPDVIDRLNSCCTWRDEDDDNYLDPEEHGTCVTVTVEVF